MTISRFLKQISKIPPVHCALVFLYRRAGLAMGKELAPYIAPNTSVLDVGCGTGIIGEAIAKTLSVSLSGTDVRDVREVEIPFALAKHNHLPFPDEAFDVILISYVLHHVEKAEVLLREARRVSRGTIIIYEDTPQNLFHRLSCFFHGLSYGSLFGIQKRCTFRTQQAWLSLFRRLKFSLVRAESVQFFNPVHVTARSLFILSPQRRSGVSRNSRS